MDLQNKLALTIEGSVKAETIGLQYVFLKSTGEHFTIKRPNTIVGNLIFGSMYVEHVGKCIITNHNTGHVMLMEFMAEGWYGVNRHKVQGDVFMSAEDIKKNVSIAKISGTWSSSIHMKKNGEDKKEMWTANPRPENSDWQYNFTKFTIMLNHLTEDLKKVLPRSDSRLRPDQRALENGQFELAAEEKHRLEEKQRAARKWRHENPGNDFKPKYFKSKVNPISNELYYAYGKEGECRDYWEDRKNQDFAHMEDLY